MKRLLFATGLLALSASSVAQSWSPLPSFQSKMGEGYQAIFGAYPLGRFQFADGNFRNTALVVTKVSMRVNRSMIYDAYTGMGRSWKNVSVEVAPADLSKLSTTFDSNPRSTPTSCYSGTMSWPTLVGVVAKPLTTYPIQVPFTSPFINTGAGRDDMIFDFRMSGGVLANNAVWGNTSPPVPQAYFTDSYLVTSAKNGVQRFWSDGKLVGCSDSAAPPPFSRAHTNQTIVRYSSAFPHAAYRNRIQFSNRTIHVGPSTPFVNVVDLAIDHVGVPFGAGCERLFLKVSPAALYFPAIADRWGYGPYNSLGLPLGLVDYNPAWRGLEVYTQSVWNDSRTNAVKLTAASSSTVPDIDLETEAEARRKCVFGATHGPTGDMSTGSFVNPIIRYN